MLSHQQLLFLLQGLGWTLLLSTFGLVGGAILGLGLAVARVSRVALPRVLAGACIQLVQGVPLPVLMFMMYFGLALSGYDVTALVAAAVSMAVFAGVFLGEIWRGSIEAVPRTQWEAADSLGLSGAQRLYDVIIPQAVILSIPPTVGFSVQVVKNTSYAVVIGFVELTQAGRIVNNTVFEPFVIFSLVGAGYFLVCYPISLASRRLERRLAAKGV